MDSLHSSSHRSLSLILFPSSFSSFSRRRPPSLHLITIPSLSSPSPPSSSAGESLISSCDYFNGKWVRDRRGPLYNGTTCGTIKEGQNCIAHGRPDLGYLYWRWKPTQCNLPRFEPLAFLQLLKNKHLAFVGDSMARNQLESLLCLLATASTPNLVYRNGEDNKFRRWLFSSHNVSLSVYWSPFLVKGIEKSSRGPNHNKLYLDIVDERWAGEMGQMDMIVLSIGHWFLHPAVYYEADSVLGCHYCPGLNHTEIGFFDVLRKALRTALNSIIEKKSAKGEAIDVTVTTFSPAHFEGEWDKAGACPKTKPYRKGEKELEGMDSDMRKIEMEEVGAAKEKALNKYKGFRLEALDVTKLALMRPDGHPGPYMHAFPFANGVQERVQNDCVHWCLPGPIDTWNEIFLEMVKKWRNENSTEMDEE
ncbi:LOW QUALITY PROTEIN: xyloglucan O-acetyltransferase 1-like [Prosopis cineraria]|uniref:LOW QUALITY PROTEIN: xyloglucan O-acetyltransferase 1-like n=1 Tax=Prosopis cineraria TaxID=364024 RepID=UPI002410A663|nr:LOW QUALITY PROTEIN: xyloglucan O-acetyltransferase 1-like [Prosopis cineraria]